LGTHKMSVGGGDVSERQQGGKKPNAGFDSEGAPNQKSRGARGRWAGSKSV